MYLINQDYSITKMCNKQLLDLLSKNLADYFLSHISLWIT